MKKPILTIAILATLPLTAMAENISGAMYVAPATETQNTPAPETNADAPYGRINIDTDDREHVASTAYVKGAYNSAIAATNKVADTVSDLSDTVDDLSSYVNNDLVDEMDNKQDKFSIMETDYEVDTEIVYDPFFDDYARSGFTNDGGIDMETHLVTAEGVAKGIIGYLHGNNGARIRVYTTWDNDNASRGVMIENAANIH